MAEMLIRHVYFGICNLQRALSGAVIFDVWKFQAMLHINDYITLRCVKNF